MLVQDSVSPLSFMSFPVVQSKNTTLLLIAEAGHTTSQPQLPHVASIVTPPNQSSVSVMLVPCIRSNMVCEPLLVQLVLRSIELPHPQLKAHQDHPEFLYSIFHPLSRNPYHKFQETVPKFR